MAGIFQTAFAAVSFAGAGYLFKLIDKNGYEAELKRHNQALESLASAKEKFYENEVRQRDKIQELRQKLSDANHDIEDTNKALDLLRKIQSIQFRGQTFKSEPKLESFYKPSDKMKEYQLIALGGLGGAFGFIIYKLT